MLGGGGGPDHLRNPPPLRQHLLALVVVDSSSTAAAATAGNRGSGAVPGQIGIPTEEHMYEEEEMVESAAESSDIDEEVIDIRTDTNTIE